MARDIFIKVRATKEERDRYAAAFEKEGKKLSEGIRAYLERKAKRATKQDNAA